MRSHLTADFRKLFAVLPSDVQQKARKNYKLWRQDPSHPSLEFKKTHTRREVYSIRVGMGWRALGLLVDEDAIMWFWIGSHNAYEKILRQL